MPGILTENFGRPVDSVVTTLKEVHQLVEGEFLIEVYTM